MGYIHGHPVGFRFWTLVLMLMRLAGGLCTESLYLTFETILSEIRGRSLIISDETNLNLCTYITVQSDQRINIDLLRYYKSSKISFITNNTRDSADVFLANRYTRYSLPCGIVTYFLPKVSEISFEWVYNVTGGFYNSVHFLILPEPPSLEEASQGLRVIFNQILVILPFQSNDFSSCVNLWTTDLFFIKLLTMGQICHEIDSHYVSSGEIDFVKNKWINFNRAPYLFATSAVIPVGPNQDELDQVTKYGLIRYNYNELETNFIDNLLLSLHLVAFAESVNATATRKAFPTQVFMAEQLPGTNFTQGLGYELSLGNAHGCFGLANDWETSRYLILTHIHEVDYFTFLTKLPTRSEGNLLFIFEAFQPFVWIVYGAVCTLLIILLLVINGWNKRSKAILAVLKPVIEQPLEDSVVAEVLTNDKARILIVCPMLGSILLVSLFKSNLTSRLVNPTYDYPPRTIKELADSDYKIETYMANSTELGAVLEDLRETPMVKKMIPRMHHYDLVTGPTVSLVNINKNVLSNWF
jgi:hypothetical protein